MEIEKVEKYELSAEELRQLKDISSLVEKVQEESDVKKVRDSKATRRAEWQKDLDSIPMEKIEAVDTAMRRFVDEHVLDKVEMEEPRVLEQEEIDKLAELYLDYEKINDLLQAKYAEIKSLVFTSLDTSSEKIAEETHTPPSQVKGALESEVHKIKFAREGGGRKQPTVNWGKLEKTLGEEKFKELVCEEEVIPEQVIEEHTIYTPSEEKFMEAFQKGDIDLESVRESITLGAWTSPRFQVRKMK